MPNDNVVTLDMTTTLDIPIDRVLDGAKVNGVTDVLVLGWDAEGELYFASSFADKPRLLWLLELAKQEILS